METTSTKITVAVLATKLDELKADTVEIKSLVKLQNGRIRKLENWRNFIAGALFLIGTVAGWVTGKVAANFDSMARLEQLHKTELGK